MLIIVSGCMKKEPDPDPAEDSNPVFGCTCTLDGITQTLQAGQNNYYMYTSFLMDSTDMQFWFLYKFRGALQQVNCQTCKSLFIEISDNKLVLSSDNSNMDSLSTGTYKFWQNSSPYDTVLVNMFSSHPMNSNTVKSTSWDFGDGSTAKDVSNPEHVYASPGTYTVCHVIEYTGGCTDELCFPVSTYGLKDCYPPVINYTYIGDTVFFQSNVDTSTHVYSWNFGDGGTSTLAYPSHQYAKNGIYKVSLEISDTANCHATAYEKIKTPYMVAGCTANFSSDANMKTIPSKKSIITVNWTNSLGNVFTTANTPQPADAFFEILSIEDYLTNESGQKTKKIHARFKCVLSDGYKVISLTDGDAVFAVAYQ